MARAEGLELEFLEQGIAVGAIVGSAKKIVEPTSGRQALRQGEEARLALLNSLLNYLLNCLLNSLLDALGPRPLTANLGILFVRKHAIHPLTVLVVRKNEGVDVARQRPIGLPCLNVV